MGTHNTPLRLAPALVAAALSCLALADPPDCDESLEWGVSRVIPARAIPGDLNADRVIDMQDVAEMLRLLTLPPNALSDAMRERADVNADARVDIDDLAALLALLDAAPQRNDCDPRINCCHLPIAFGGCCGIPDDCTPGGTGGDGDLEEPGGGPGGIGGGGGGPGDGGGGPDPIGNPPGGGGGDGNPPDCSFYITPDFPYEKNNPPAQAPNIPFIGIDHLVLTARTDVTVPKVVEWYFIIDGFDDGVPDYIAHTIPFNPDCLLSHYQVRAVSRKPDGTICREVGPIDLTIHRAVPRSVTFGGGNHPIYDDFDENLEFRELQWLDLDHDGLTAGPDERSWPVAYTRNTPMTIAAFETHFSKDAFGDMPQPGDYTIRGTGADGSVYTLGRQGLTGVGSALLPDHVAHQPNYSIAWEISFDGQHLWFPIGATTHRVYITLGTPLNLRLDSLYHIAVSNAELAVTMTDARNRLWLQFQTRNITNARGEPLGYYRHGPGHWANNVVTTQELITSTDGQCLAWATLLRDTLRIYGYADSAVASISPKSPPIPNGCNGSQPMMMIKNYDFLAAGSSDCTNYPFRLISPAYSTQPPAWPAIDCIDRPGLPGQDSANPTSIFRVHYITRLTNTALPPLYDPAYGIGPYSNIMAWQTEAIAGFAAGTPSNRLGARIPVSSVAEVQLHH